ncbi:conserved protein of unknown function [Pseudodesulfovibrio profundus]|uniref:Uncharacterized protein n=1 Tax=Pseudodesulfovibrio profundus TaxID=57320 RepID=A0A2C8F5E2_9BACT|nr:hypothetical protein [Pseudodesulfovibrio profundus]SOB57938.1 conserved protein of unknown function [Pseudodesulfovibrio profundus]
MTHDSERERLLGLIDRAKELPVYPRVNWDDSVWDITEYQKRKGHKGRAWRLKFLQKAQKRVALDRRVSFASDFSNFCKCLVKIKQQQKNISFDPHQRMLDSLAVLYEILRASNTDCDPTYLNKKHFKLAEDVLLREYKQTTAYRMANSLQEVAKFIDEHRLTPLRIGYHSTIKKERVGDLRDQIGQAKGMEKMPSEEVFEALAEISNTPLDDEELIRIRIIDLLVVGGFRIGEVLSLPVNCWISKPQFSKDGNPLINQETGEQEVSYGIRYWPEKGGEPSIKWIPSHAVSLAKRAIDGLTEHCAKARARAYVLEQTPERVPLSSDCNSEDIVSAKKIGELVEANRGGDFVRQLGVSPVITSKRRKDPVACFRIGDVEKALLNRRKPLIILERPGGKSQKLSESLCVCFYYQFKTSAKTFKLLAEPINEQHISDLLGGRKTKKSAFSRRNMKAADGSPLRINTHAFRHWLTTLADHGGLNELQIARWMGRKDIRHNEAYKHGTVAQRVAYAKELIKGGGLAGPITEVYEGLDPIDREHFLEAHVSTVHFTPLGLCLHDYSIEPCEYHLKCLEGCLEYLRTKGNERERLNLQKLEDVLVLQIDRYKDSSGSFENPDDPFLRHSLRQLDGVKAALAVDDILSGECVDEGEQIRVFSGDEGGGSEA